MAALSLLKLSKLQIRIITFYLLNILGVMESVLSLYPTQSWDTSILPVLSSYGEPFMDVVCRDSCDGHDVGRVSMLSSINLRKYVLPPPLKFPPLCWFHSTRLSLYKCKRKKNFPDQDIHSRSNFVMTVRINISLWTVSVRRFKLEAKACNSWQEQETWDSQAVIDFNFCSWLTGKKCIFGLIGLFAALH